MDIAVAQRPRAPSPIDVEGIRRALDDATDPPAVLAIETKLDAAEKYMRDSGLCSDDEISQRDAHARALEAGPAA
jgi:hypothetical protein